MQTIYITTPGLTIHKNGEVLEARKDGSLYNTIFPYRTEQLVVFGGVELSRSAINLLLKHQINTVFLSVNGRYNGELVPPIGKNVFLRKKQYDHQNDPVFNLKIAKEIVAGKIKNQVVILNRIRRFQGKDTSLQERKVRDILEKIPSADNLDVLRGCEGLAAKLYFEVFDLGFTRSQNFTKRVRRPPTDPVNAALSFLYTLLFYRLSGVIERLGMDPYLGHLHSLSYGRKSLALDLMEEYRPIVVDTAVFSLFNLNIISADDFEVAAEDDIDDKPFQEKPAEALVVDDKMGVFGERPLLERAGHSLDDDGHDDAPNEPWRYSPKPPVIFKKDALSKVIKNFERKLDDEFFYERTRETVTFKKAFELQVARYRQTLEGDVDHYVPLVMR